MLNYYLLNICWQNCDEGFVIFEKIKLNGMKNYYLFFCCTVFLALSLSAQKSIIKNITVVPTHINQSFEKKDVVIKDGKILAIRDHLIEDTASYDKVIDGTGKYVMPGMVDAHAHFPEKEMIETYFLMNLANGVTTLRSMRGEEWHLELDRKAELTPNLILSSVPLRRSDSLSVDAVDGMVRENKEAGFDFIKILSIASAEHFDALVASCKKYNVKVAGHCSRPVDYEVALKSNVYESIEHLHGYAWMREFEKILSTLDIGIENSVAITPTTDWYYFSPENLKELKARSGFEHVSKNKIKQWEQDIATELDTMSQEQLDNYSEKRKRNYDYRNRLTGFAYKQGATLLVGPDLEGYYGVPGFGYVEELKHFERSGLSNFDILKAATYNMSIARNTTTKNGTIKTGMEANLVILTENPLENIENVTSTEYVVLRGEIFTREELIKALKKLLKYE